MVKWLLSILLVYLGSFKICSQKQDYTWILGYGCSANDSDVWGKSIISFSNDSILSIMYDPSSCTSDLGFNNASYCNDNGEFLFFTNSFHIFGKDQKIIKNGDTINPGEIWDFYSNGFYPMGNNNVFLPEPGNSEKVYLIHKSKAIFYDSINRPIRGYCDKLNYSIIDTKLDQGKGEVIEKNKVVYKGDFSEDRMAYIRHANGRDWWIVIEEYLNNKFFIFLLTDKGFLPPIIQYIGIKPSSKYDFYGQLLFTPDGTKLIKSSTKDKLQIFDFDRCSGKLSNPNYIGNFDVPANPILCDIEVSSNSQFLYLNPNDKKIWQYDLLASDIPASKKFIAQWDSFVYDRSFPTYFGQLRLAPDNKIYISTSNSTIYLHCITEPNKSGTDCNLIQRYVTLPSIMFYGLPNFANYRLGALKGSGCDTITTRIEETAMEKHFTIYPNPVSNTLNIESFDFPIQSYKIVNLRGQALLNHELNQNKSTINISDLSDGLYFISLKIEDKIYKKKIIIQK